MHLFQGNVLGFFSPSTSVDLVFPRMRCHGDDFMDCYGVPPLPFSTLWNGATRGEYAGVKNHCLIIAMKLERFQLMRASHLLSLVVMMNPPHSPFPLSAMYVQLNSSRKDK